MPFDSKHHDESRSDGMSYMEIFPKFQWTESLLSFCHFREKCANNRWLCAFVCCITVFLCSTPYNNWDAFVELLYQGGVYNWYCNDGSLSSAVPCEAQRTKIEPLFYFASGSEYTVGVIAGLLFDFSGPRYCGLIGIFILILGLLTLIVSSQSFPLYALSVVLIGCSTNIIAFPGLILGNLFPLHKSHALTILMACQLGSSLIPVVIKLIWTAIGSSVTLSKMMLFYMCFAVFPCCIGYFIFLPRHRMNENVVTVTSSFDKIDNSNSSRTDTTEDLKKRYSAAYELSAKKNLSNESLVSQSHNGIGEITSEMRKNAPFLSDAPERNQSRIRGDWTLLKKEIKTWDIHLFNMYYIIQVIQFLYFQSTIERIYGSNALSVAGYVALLQVVFGIGVSFIVNYVGTLFLCAVLVFLNFFVYGSIIFNIKTPIVSILLNNLGYSFIFTSKITFLADNYQENNLGQLVGFISFTAGCASVGMGVFSSLLSYKTWALIFVLTCFVCSILLLTLWRRSGKTKRG